MYGSLLSRGSPRDGRGPRQPVPGSRGTIQSHSTNSAAPQADASSQISGPQTPGSRPPKRNFLRRELGFISTLALAVNLILGSGIFITPSTVLLRTRSFGLSIVLWVGGALLVYSAALCFLELALIVKKSGSTFIFIKDAYSFTLAKPWMETCGSLLSFLMLWSDIVICQPTGSAIPLLALGRYLCRPFFMDCEVMPIYAVKMFALTGLMLITIVSIYSVRLSASLLTWLSFLKIVAIVFVIILGMWKLIQRGSFPEDSWHPFEGSDTSPIHIALGLYAIVFTYDGWTVVVGVQEETKGISTVKWVTFVTLPIIGIIYILTNISFFAVLSYDQISSAQAVGLLFGEAVLGKAGLVIFCLISVVLMFGGASASLFLASREIFVAGREGFVPQFLSGVHVTYRTPLLSILLMNFMTGIFIVIGNIDSLINMFSAIQWLWYGTAVFGVIIMRLTRPHIHRPFEVILLLPAVTTVVAILLVVLPLWQDPISQLIGFAINLTGVPVYVVLVMETPYKLRPKVMDRLSAWLTSITCKQFNMEVSDSFDPFAK